MVAVSASDDAGEAVNDRAIEGLGTPEADWLGWPGLARLPVTTAAALVPPGARAVVVAPHPDDEVLAVGGLLAMLARDDVPATVIAVTDGAASHTGSLEWPRSRLLRERPRETARALDTLGLRCELLRLHLPDGGVTASALVARLAPLLQATDVVFTTWRHDGHPDHEATGTGCAEATALAGARLVEVPVWAWHWAVPGDPRLPWDRARRVLLDPAAATCKRAAVQCFTSQLRPDPSTGAGPILRSTTVERAARPFEVVFA